MRETEDRNSLEDPRWRKEGLAKWTVVGAVHKMGEKTLNGVAQRRSNGWRYIKERTKPTVELRRKEGDLTWPVAGQVK